ncbi:hypothetical protein QBC43DRAFT_316777 [Cladorrhinum sp. PSN259]|nr:hypothetical protein QBC43DRAFT_316777 [Cladorrhinum sp. PSN259]
MTKGYQSSSNHRNYSPNSKEAQEARAARLQQFQNEPIREGNFLVEVPYRPLRKTKESKREMDQKIEKIMRGF